MMVCMKNRLIRACRPNDFSSLLIRAVFWICLILIWNASFLQGARKKSMPEVWWRGSGREVRIYTYTGNAVDNLHRSRLRSGVHLHPTGEIKRTVHAGVGVPPRRSWSLGGFPVLPSDPRVHTRWGWAMTSVTLNWATSSSVVVKDGHRPHHEYCVLVNHKHNYRSLCAAREGIRKEIQSVQKRQRRSKQSKEVVWATLKDWWWRQPDALKNGESSTTEKFEDPGCVCRDIESVCTVSDLLPDTQYYFDVFVVDRVNGTSAAYTGTFARTHEEARPAVTSYGKARSNGLPWAGTQAVYRGISSDLNLVAGNKTASLPCTPVTALVKSRSPSPVKDRLWRLKRWDISLPRYGCTVPHRTSSSSRPWL